MPFTPVSSYTMTPSALQPLLTVNGLVNNDIKFTFLGQEDKDMIEMVLTPEENITPVELLKIFKLTMYIASNGTMGYDTLLGYIRSHNLERHFKFTVQK